MNGTEFNLLCEKWIIVMRMDGGLEKVSIRDAICNAHLYMRIAGELPTQDVAILRVLLAVLHAVFARYDLDGQYAPLLEYADPPATGADAIERWRALWERRSFPAGPVDRYLDHFQDRFFLFHPDHPFFQVPRMLACTSYSAAKLNGELSQSTNKLRLFPVRSGAKRELMEYDEAARWLIYVNAFDDTSAKQRKDGESEGKLPSPGAGWLGKLGLIYAVGDTLFDTLLLNLVLLKNGSELWEEEKPVWEEEVRSGQRTEIPFPDNPSGLYTLQSRRLLLSRDETTGLVNGYGLLGGDFFDKTNAFIEQMTLWRGAAAKKNGPVEYVPRRHSPDRKLWRDFAPIAVAAEDSVRPGLVNFLARLRAEGALRMPVVRFQTACVKYGDKDFFVDDVFSDELSFNADLLTSLGEMWMPRILEAISLSEKLVRQLGTLAADLEKCMGDTEGEGARESAREQGYYALDLPFRIWLESIDPADESANVDEICAQWFRTAQRQVRDIGQELTSNAGGKAFVGRTETDRNKREVRYTAPEAYNRFMACTTEKYLKGVK